MQINRLFEITYYLLNRNNVTAKELAERFNVSKRTIYRDINVLSLSGIPVCTTSGNGGGISLMDGYVLSKSVLNEREQNEILSALQGLIAVKTDETAQVLSKLGSFFNRGIPNWIEVDFSSWGHCGCDYLFPSIKKAIFEKCVVEFDYYNSYGQKRHRRVEPIQLWFRSKYWYFKGFCLEKQAVRLYKLTRIKNLAVTDELFYDRDYSYVEPPASEPEDKRKYVTVALKIAPEMTYRVYDDFGEEQITKNDDESFTVTLTEAEDNWLYGYLLSFGEYAEILEPPYMRDIIKEIARKIDGKYV